MFIKVTKSGKNEYAQVVRSFRENGKIKHETLLNLGRKDKIEEDPGMQRMALKLIELARVKEVIDIKRAKNGQIVKWGDIVYQKLWDETNIEGALEKCPEAKGTWFDFKKTCLYLITRYLLAAQEESYYFTANISANQFYRTLDILGKNQEKIETFLFPDRKKLINPILCLLIPVTFKNTSVESLDQLDYDYYLKRVEVMSMVIIDFSGRILSQEIFSNRRFGRANLVQAITRTRNKFNISSPIIVTDQVYETSLLQDFQYISSAPVEPPPEEVTGIHYGIKTNIKTLRPEGILKSYHFLEYFLETFQPGKTHPSLQWTERRIKGHFIICFLAAILGNRLENKLARAEKKASPEKIREALNSLQFVRFQAGEASYLLPISSQNLSPEILRFLGISPPQGIVSEEDFIL